MTGATIDPRISKARSALVMRQPFFGTLALYLRPVADATCETMATDGETLFYNPAFLDTLSPDELKGVVAHEVLHCAYRHHTRRGHRENALWNKAADYVINRDLDAAGFTLPDDALRDARFGDLGAEQIYRVLDDERQKQKEEQPGGDQGGAGNGDPQPSDPGKCGEVRDAAPSSSPGAIAEQEAQWDNRIRQALNVAKASNAGTVPGALQRLAASNAASRVDWRETLRRFVDGRARTDTSWTRPDRRYLSAGFILPGRVVDGLNHIAICVDNSGSIDDRALSRFVAEIQVAVDEGAAEQVTVIYCDTAVNKVAEFTRGDEFKIDANGGGGTRFSPAIAWVAENAGDVSALIYFTDMQCDDFGEAPACPVLWAAYGDARRRSAAPFGETVEIEVSP